MHALLTTLTALSLSIHALMGCCWHHAHACAGDVNTNVAVVEPGAGCHHCHHGCDKQANDHHSGESFAPDSQSDLPQPCQCKLECQGVCTYLPPEKSPLDSFADAAAFDLPLATLAQGYVAVTSAADCQWLADPGGARESNRLHLLHQVLLI